MQVTETLSDGLKRGYTVVVPASDIEGKRSAKLAELARTMQLPGFRPGKVPTSVVRQRYGTAVMSEVLEQSVNDATRQVLEDRGLRSATQPKVDVVSIDDGRDLEFNVELELLPEVPMPDFAAIPLTRLRATPPVESIAGFIPGFSDGMEGMRPGETREIAVTFPAEYQAKELAGKAATFDITAKSLQQSVPAELNDDLAAKLGLENMEKLREVIGGQIQREYDQISRMRIKRELLDQLAARAEFPVPQGMVDGEFEQIWARVESDRKEGRGDEEDRAKDDETLKAEYRAIAERRVRLGLLLSEVGRANGIQVQPDELTRAMRAEAGRYPGQEGQVMEFFRKNPQAAEGLRGPIFEDKVVDFVLELAQVEERQVAPEELSAEPEAPAQETQAQAQEAQAQPAADPANEPAPAA